MQKKLAVAKVAAVVTAILLFNGLGMAFAKTADQGTKWWIEKGHLCRQSEEKQQAWSLVDIPWMAFIGAVEKRAQQGQETTIWVDSPGLVRVATVKNGTVTAAKLFKKGEAIPAKYKTSGKKILWVLLRQGLIRKVMEGKKVLSESRFPWASAYVLPFLPREEYRVQGGKDSDVWVDMPGIVSHLQVRDGQSAKIRTFKKGEAIPADLRSKDTKVLWIMTKDKLYRRFLAGGVIREERVYPTRQLPLFSFIGNTELAQDSEKGCASFQTPAGKIVFETNQGRLVHFGRQEDKPVVMETEMEVEKVVTKAPAAASAQQMTPSADLETLTEELASLKAEVQDLRQLAKNPDEPRNEKDKDEPFILSALFQFGWVMTDKQNKGGNARSPYSGAATADATFFDVPVMRLYIAKKLEEGVSLHFNINAAAGPNRGGGLTILDAYISIDEFLGKSIGAEIGSIGSPMQMEKKGHFINCNSFISDSNLGEFVDSFGGWGIAFAPNGQKPGAVDWTVGILSGTDTADTPNDFVGITNGGIGLGGELDDSIGGFIHIQKAPQREGQIGWHASYATNGGDVDATNASNEVDFFTCGARWRKDNLLFNTAFLSGDWEGAAGAQSEFDMFYFIANYAFDKRTNVAVRYETWDNEGTEASSGKSYTFGLNRKMSGHSSLQFEYVAPKEDEEGGRVDEADDLFQCRYNWKF